MPGTPFFRGHNRLDMFFLSLLQHACDFGTATLARQVADCWTLQSFEVYQPLRSIAPPVSVAVCQDYVFVLTGSTRDPLQWLGNVLGSEAIPFPHGAGSVGAYFYAVALSQYLAARSAILAAAPGRRVVIAGFSLGAASATLIKAMLQHDDGLPSSCFAIASPRPGNTTFAAGFPSADFVRWQYNADVVPSTPPTTWAGLGLHAGWIPVAPFVTYAHVSPGSTLYLPSEIRAGDQLPSLTDAILAFDAGLYRQFHAPGLYAQVLRAGEGLALVDGQDDHPHASLYDLLASQTFASPSPWLWSHTMPSVSTGGNLLQTVVGLRNKGTPHGWKETYFFLGTNPETLNNFWVLGSPYNMLTLRAAFLSTKCEIYYIRSSRVGSVKASALHKLSSPVAGQDGTSSALADDSIVFFGYGNNRQSKRQFHFRGIPDSYVEADQLAKTGRGALPKMTFFLQKLVDAEMRILSPSIQAQSAISNVAKAAAADPIVVTLEDALTIGANKLVEIIGCRQTPLLRGKWLTPGTAGVPATTLTIAGSQWLQPKIPTTGLLRLLNYDTTFGWPIDAIEFNGIGSRKTGPQDFLPRGRRSVQVRRR